MQTTDRLNTKIICLESEISTYKSTIDLQMNEIEELKKDNTN